jgi:hypothetical protein
VLLVASSYVTLAFHTRAFSNAVESAALAALLAAALLAPQLAHLCMVLRGDGWWLLF